MTWKFWKRLFGRTDGEQQQELQAVVSSHANTAAAGFPLFPNSNREVVALQRLVGNQIVLELLERCRLAANASISRSEAEPESSRGLWRWWSRSEKERV